MRVTYLLRMRGMVLPRRMKVELPTPDMTSHSNPLYITGLPSPSMPENDVPLPGELQGEGGEQEEEGVAHPVRRTSAPGPY
jgi:hypothetical protein